MNPTVGQPLEPSGNHWRGPEYRGDSGADWVREHGFGAEDWNFDLTQVIDGHLYGYGQGRVSKERRKRAKQFDVLFYVRDPDGTFRAAGLYLNATYIDEVEAEEVWQSLRSAGIVRRRSASIRAAFGTHRAAATKAVAAFEAGNHVRWRVEEQDVFLFEDRPAFVPLRPTDWRATNAYDLSPHPWFDLVPAADIPGAIEGRLKTRVHMVRERSAAFRRAVLERRKGTQGRLHCEACGFDFGRVYGEALDDFIEAHHTVPLATAPGARVVSASEIALLCANCHRAAHQTEQHTVAALKALMARSKAQR